LYFGALEKAAHLYNLQNYNKALLYFLMQVEDQSIGCNVRRVFYYYCFALDLKGRWF